MLNSIEAASSYLRSADLSSSYDRVEEVITNAKDRNLSRSRDIRGPLADLVAQLEAKAMDIFNEAKNDYFEGNHESALAEFRELARFEGLQAAKEAGRELRKEDARAEWRSVRDTLVPQMEAGEYAAAQEGLRDLARLARRTGYDAATDSLLSGFGEDLSARIADAKQAIADEDFEAAYGVLFEASRLTPLREHSIEARQLLREYANDPGMKQAEREYIGASELAEIRRELADAEGRRNEANVREQAQRKLEQLARTFEGTRAGAEAEQLAAELADQVASR